MWYMVAVQCKELRNMHLTLLLEVTMPLVGYGGGHIIVRSSSDVFILQFGVAFEGLF